MLRARVCGVVRGARWVVPRVGSVPGPAPCCPPGAAGDGEAGAVHDLRCCSQRTGGLGELEISAVLFSCWVFSSSPFSMLVVRILGRVIYSIPRWCA